LYACVAAPINGQNIQVRLQGGTATQGRLEILYNNQWGTVCDDGFNTQDAQVACRMLGQTR
jgi:hypothetical protein